MTDALQLVKAYVAAVFKYEMTDEEADYETCETIWVKMVELAQGGE